MSVAAPDPSDVPALFDVVIQGSFGVGSTYVSHGYNLLRTVDTSLPYRTQRASYAYTPTFLERTNVSGAYSDNQQDFFLTVSQNDWSLGEGQRFFRADEDGRRQMWQAAKADISVPGQVTIMPATKTVTFAAAVSGVGTNQSPFFAASSTNLYEYDGASITDRGAHGAGGLPTSIAFDGTFIYLAGSATTALRKYDTSAHTFATFNAASYGSIAYLNNALWATGTGALVTFDTAGTATTVYTWKNSVGTALGNTKPIVPFGGKMAVLTPSAQNAFAAEIWVADTTGAQRVAELPRSFSERAICQADGILFVIGAEYKGAALGSRTAIYYLANGTLGKLWASPTYTTATFGGQDIVPYQNGLLFTDIVSNTIKYYDLTTAAVSSVTTWTPTSSDVYFSATGTGFAIMSQNATTPTYFFDSTVATTATVTSSLYDFDNSLTKLFRGIKVDYVAATDGNGGTVDIAYRVNDLDGAYTTLQTGAVSGTEYTLPAATTGRGITVKVTLNKGTSTLGPVLKRVYARAAPILQAYRLREFILDLSGRDGKSSVVLNDGQSSHPLDGLAMATNLNLAIASTTPVQITDRFGTQTAVLEPGQSELIEIRPEEYIGKVATREV